MAQAAAAAATSAVMKEIKGRVRLLLSSMILLTLSFVLSSPPLKVLSGEAKPGPSIGQSLGPLGLNMAEFCKQFNAVTSKMKPGIPVPVRLIAYKDRTFQFTTQTPPTTWFLKKCANIEKGSAKPVLEMVGKVTLKQIYEIAAIKQMDAHVKHIPLEHICRSIVGSARTMGIEVITGREDTKAARAAAAAAAAANASTATSVPVSKEAADKDAGKPAQPAGAAKDAKPAAAKPTAAAKPAAGDAKSADPKAKQGGDDKKKPPKQ